MEGIAYWLHRASYEGGIDILTQERKLTIGFSAAASSQELRDALARRDWQAFCKAYTDVYEGEIERQKGGLWRFAVDMKIGDTVVVPVAYGFFVCKVAGDAAVCNRDGCDLGWERDVDIVAECSPREAYAPSSLLSRMKCRQTNLNIDDLAADVEEALSRKQNNKPVDIVGDMAVKLRDELIEYCKPEAFEEYVASYFRSLGATAEILSKNYSNKQGDCDVEAVFPALRLTVAIQCKKHVGTTDDWAVRQISDYADKRNNDYADANWTYAYWVISLADRFSDDALKFAREKGVTLIDGNEFCRMLMNAGIR